jgi:hypothetical protein
MSKSEWSYSLLSRETVVWWYLTSNGTLQVSREKMYKVGMVIILWWLPVYVECSLWRWYSWTYSEHLCVKTESGDYTRFLCEYLLSFETARNKLARRIAKLVMRWTHRPGRKVLGSILASATKGAQLERLIVIPCEIIKICWSFDHWPVLVCKAVGLLNKKLWSICMNWMIDKLGMNDLWLVMDRWVDRSVGSINSFIHWFWVRSVQFSSELIFKWERKEWLLYAHTHRNILGGWSHYTDTSEPAVAYGAQNMVTVQSGIRTSDLSITNPTH